MVDYIVVGGGIAGLSIAYLLQSRNYSVLLFEAEKIGSGGSGAAGAFLFPKVGKQGELAHLINSAINFSINFYLNHFPKYIHLSKLQYVDTNSIVDGAVVDADEVLESMGRNIDIAFSRISKIEETSNGWRIEDIESRNLILATGAFPTLVDEPYIKVRPVWGERIDITSDRYLNNSYHDEISISQTINGKIRIGATHFRNILHRDSSILEQEKLLNRAKKIVDLGNTSIVGSYSGVRSASHDYFPIFGKVVNSQKTIEKFPNIVHGKKYREDEYIYYPNLYIWTGLGGYGFSLAPYLSSLFLSNRLPAIVQPHRRFSRWVRKRENR
ncbi:MAG TPA: FAD-dependent oxidoreductase [Campylobacterales bacterium]|nr:FAD-dependent oxidoreductase [Campylobacterales bacterium]